MGGAQQEFTLLGELGEKTVVGWIALFNLTDFTAVLSDFSLLNPANNYNSLTLISPSALSTISLSKLTRTVSYSLAV